MIARALITLCAAVILGLGVIHFIYTFWGPKLLPRDRSLRASMEATSPVISSETTMWKTWIGFNASHALGAILFGLVYGYLALIHPAFLFQSGFLLLVGFAALVSYALLGKAYWFSIPFTGILIALVCFAAGIAVQWVAPAG
jgi:hypothetical protein